MPRLNSTDLEKGLYTQSGIYVDLLESGPDQNSVDPGKGDNVRDSSHSHQVQVVHQGRFLPFLEKIFFPETFSQTRNKVKSQSDTRKRFVGKGTSDKKGVNKGSCIR